MGFEEKFIGKEDLLWNRSDLNEPVIFWGCGNNAKIVGKLLAEKGMHPTAYCDNNPELIGKKQDGAEVLSYEQVRERYGKCNMVLTVAVNNATAIKKQLEKYGEGYLKAGYST